MQKLHGHDGGASVTCLQGGGKIDCLVEDQQALFLLLLLLLLLFKDSRHISVALAVMLKR